MTGLLAMLMLHGCQKAILTPGLVAETPIDMARKQPDVEAARARFRISFRSELTDLAGNTGGALILDRPGRGHLAVLGPLGSPLLTVTSDGEGLSMVFPRSKEHLVALDAEYVLRQTTGGALGLDDLLALLVGDLPLDHADVLDQHTDDDGHTTVVLSGPRGTSVHAVLDVEARPTHIEVHSASGVVLLQARYGPFTVNSDKEAGSPALPQDVTLELPSLGARVELHHRNLTMLDTLPDVFGLDAPEGFVTDALEDRVRRAVDRAAWLEQAAQATTASPDP